MLSCTLVQKAVFTLSRRNVNLLLTDHIVEPVRIDACRIDYIPGPEGSLICMQRIASIDFDDVLYFCPEMEFYSVFIRIFCQGNIQPERTDDPGSWGV